MRISFEIGDRDGFRQRLLAAGVRLGPTTAIDHGWSEIRMASSLILESRAMRGAATPTSLEPEAVEGEESVTVAWAIDQG